MNNKSHVIAVYKTKEGNWDYGYLDLEDWKPINLDYLNSDKVDKFKLHNFPKENPYVFEFIDKRAKEFISRLNKEKLNDINAKLNEIFDINALEVKLT